MRYRLKEPLGLVNGKNMLDMKLSNRLMAIGGLMSRVLPNRRQRRTSARGSDMEIGKHHREFSVPECRLVAPRLRGLEKPNAAIKQIAAQRWGAIISYVHRGWS
jgi:hypothetical protein